MISPRRMPLDRPGVVGLLGRWALLLGLGAAAPGGLVACGHSRAVPAPPPSAVQPAGPDPVQGVETGIPVSSSPQGLMQQGAEKKIQLRLKAQGLLTAEQCTGQLDASTRAALRKFQKEEGIPPTGLPSYETIRRLRLDLGSIFHTVARPRQPPPRAPG